VAQDINVALDEISHVKVLPVGAEHDAFGKAADVRLCHLANALSIDLEEHHVGFLMPVEGGLGCAAGAVEDQRGGITARRADSEPFWTIADQRPGR
jgi:hypothetical protein